MDKKGLKCGPLEQNLALSLLPSYNYKVGQNH